MVLLRLLLSSFIHFYTRYTIIIDYCGDYSTLYLCVWVNLYICANAIKKKKKFCPYLQLFRDAAAICSRCIAHQKEHIHNMHNSLPFTRCAKIPFHIYVAKVLKLHRLSFYTLIAISYINYIYRGYLNIIIHRHIISCICTCTCTGRCMHTYSLPRHQQLYTRCMPRIIMKGMLNCEGKGNYRS